MKKLIQLFFILIVVVGGGIGFYYWNYSRKEIRNQEIIMSDLKNKTLEEVQEYAEKYQLKLEVEYQYSYDFSKDRVMEQSIQAKDQVKIGDKVLVVVSKGEMPVEVFQEKGVNELGKVPIMMYHGIVDVSSRETGYTGGNVDRDGYQRTAEAFRQDLEFYYQQGYRMMRLMDYIDGNVAVELGYSPIILTFDDGHENNFKVLGEENGELVIDPNCAVGILESFKEKYPDYGVTATFFVNSGLFQQEDYNHKILKWLVSHGYDIGNHTMTHADFTKIGVEESKKEVGGLYQILESIIPGKYVPIVALPFGSPYKSTHANYASILEGDYLDVHYETKGALRVGWEAELSCFDQNFNPGFLKRIRAYDNLGKDFDIEYNFKILKNKRYVSDGDAETIVIRKENQDQVKNTSKRIIGY